MIQLIILFERAKEACEETFEASKVSSHASFALSNNIINWITEFYNEESTAINFDFADEVIQSSVLAYEGKIMNERFA